MADAREYVEERGMKHVYPLVSLVEGQVKSASGDNEGALESFMRVEDLALEMGMRPMAWHGRSGAAQALSELGRNDEAGAKMAEARAVVDEIAALFDDDALRSMYLKNATGKLAEVSAVSA